MNDPLETAPRSPAAPGPRFPGLPFLLGVAVTIALVSVVAPSYRENLPESDLERALGVKRYLLELPEGVGPSAVEVHWVIGPDEIARRGSVSGLSPGDRIRVYVIDDARGFPERLAILTDDTTTRFDLYLPPGVDPRLLDASTSLAGPLVRPGQVLERWGPATAAMSGNPNAPVAPGQIALRIVLGP